MIDIVGFVRIDETKPDRVRSLIACIRSYSFLANTGAKFILGLEKPSNSFVNLIYREINEAGLIPALEPCTGDIYPYGKQYMNLLAKCRADYVINFMEDHFMVCDSVDTIDRLIESMRLHKVDVCKATFHKIEVNSCQGIEKLNAGYGWVFENNEPNFKSYCSHYGRRYFLGVNFITSLSFARKFWDRSCGKTPHGYEIAMFDPEWVHRVMVPEQELMAAIDDDHGEPDSCLLKRSNEKFLSIWKSVQDKLSGNAQLAAAEQPAAESVPETFLRDEPWLTESANAFLQYYFSVNKNIWVLEFGSGASTVWFAKQPNLALLRCIEHDEGWGRLSQANIPPSIDANRYIICIHERPYNTICDSMSEAIYDLCLVDGRDRALCIESAIPKLKSKGVLILDNSEREQYQKAIKLMKDWPVIHTYQKERDKYGFFYEGWRTSIYFKP